MKHAIQFLTAALKDVPASICDSQLAAIDAVRVIFTNGTIKPIHNKTTRAPLIKRQAEPEIYRVPTSKGDQENQPATTCKGALKQTVHIFPKNKDITINTVDHQKPISRRTRSSKITETLQNTTKPIVQRTRSKTFEQKYTTPSHSRAIVT